MVSLFLLGEFGIEIAALRAIITKLGVIPPFQRDVNGIRR
jgi:hypothetical protein